MHSGVIEKRSFNGFDALPNNLSPAVSVTFFGANPQSRSSNLLAAPPSGHCSLRRSRSASPATGAMHRSAREAQAHAVQAQALLLSADQQTLIRKSWLRIPKASFGKAVFEQMIASGGPSVARLFDPADAEAVARHERYFAELVQRAVDLAETDPRGLSQWLEMVGRGHAQLRVRRSHWDCLGGALTNAICQWLPAGRHRRDTVHAWRVLLSFVADRLGSSHPLPAHCPSSSPRIQLLQLVTDIGHVGEQLQKTP